MKLTKVFFHEPLPGELWASVFTISCVERSWRDCWYFYICFVFLKEGPLNSLTSKGPHKTWILPPGIIVKKCRDVKRKQLSLGELFVKCMNYSFF